MILHNSKRRSWHLILASAVVFGLIQLCQSEQASAQVLDQKVNDLLAGNCAGLGVSGTDPGFGVNLNALCQFPPTAGASSTGGGAASVQGSAASILNRLLLQRMYETDEEEGQAHARSSSMKI